MQPSAIMNVIVSTVWDLVFDFHDPLRKSHILIPAAF